MDAGNRNEETIFHAAIEIDSPQERDAYVKSACGEDAELLSRVQGLLKYHFDNKSFLKSPAAAAVTLNESPATEKPGETIGRYKLLQQIGEGGFGVVYMAEQRHPIQRKVALKIIKLGMDTKQVIARFEAERQALAMMDHPNIAKVLDAGATATGRPYFVMELVKGIPVTEYCDKNDLDTHQRLKLFIDICKAVQHAHHKGIIHRDIKPSNIMITLRDDDSPVPKVIDFGIAKATQARLTEKTLFTEFRQFIGTPEYMSPEQARMGEMGVDTRSDVYSLGVLLYELLTGTTPFDSQTLRNAGYNEIQRIISEDEPPKPSTRLSTLGDSLADVARHRKMAPSQLRREIRGELDWIILKTLEKDRTRRYGSADELVLDIQRHLTHQPVAAGPPSKLYRMKKFSQRHRVEVMTAAAIVITLVIGFAVSTILYFQAEEARKKESTARAVAVKAKEETQRVNENLTWENYIASIGMAQRLVEKGDLAGARKLLLNCPEEYRNWEWGHLLYLCNPDLKSVKIDAKLIFHTSFSPDGKWLAVGGNQNLELWDGGMENKISTLPGRLAAFSTDGKYVAVAGGPKGIEASKHITIVDLTTFRKVKTFYGHDRGIKSLVFSPDGKLIASCDHAGVAMIHDVEGGNPLYQLDMPRLTCIAFSPDGKHLVTGQERESNSIRLWNAQTGALLGGHDSHLFSVHSVLFTPDSKTVISSSSTESDVLAWDIQTETVKKLPGLQKKSVDSLAMSKDGRHLAMKCRDGTVRLYDFKEQDEVHSFKGAGGFAPYDTFTPPIAFSPDGRRLVACDLRDSVVKVWNIEKFKNDYLRLTGHTGDINAMAFTPDGRYLVTGAGNWNSYPANDHTAKIWDLDTRHMIHGLVTHSGQVQGVAINLDGSLVATSTAWGLIDIWSLQTGAHIRRLESRDGYTYPLVFHPTENILVAGTTFSAQIWDVTTGQKLQSFKGHDEFVWSTDISPDGNFVASASFDKRINIWDRQSEKPIKEFLGHGGYVRDVAFSPDGTLLASASHDYTARIWDIALEKTIHILESNNDVLQVVFSPDGRRLLTASRHGTIKIWDVETGRELIELEHTLNLDPSIAMSRDGRTIAFGQEHDAVILFSFPWQLDQYPGDTSTPFEHRIEQYKRSFWQQWFNHKSTKMVSNSYALTEDPKRVSLAKYNDLLLDQVDMTPELLKEAVTDYTTAIQDSPNEWWLWKNRAMCYGKLENWDKAVADYTRAIEISPNDFELFNKRSLAYTNLGQQEKATHDINKAGSMATTAETLSSFADTLEKIGKFEMAEQAYSKAIELDPDNHSKWQERGNLYLQMHRGNEAIADFTRAMELDPDDWWSWHERGYAYMQLSQWDNVVSDYSTAIKMRPDISSNHIRRAEAYGHLGQLEKALHDLNKVIELDPENPNCWLARANFYSKMKQWDKAKQDYSQIVELDLNDINISLFCYRCALIQLDTGNEQGYRQKCISMLEQFEGTDDPAIAHWTAWTCVLAPDAVDDLGKIVKLAEHAVEKGDEMDQNHSTLGAVLYRAGQYEEAVEQLTELSNKWEEAPQYPDSTSPAYAWFFLAMAHQQSGDPEKANFWFEKAVQRSEEELKDTPVWNRTLTLQLFQAEAAQLLGAE